MTPTGYTEYAQVTINPEGLFFWVASGTKSGPSRDQARILDKCLYDSAIGELLAIAGRTNRTKFRDQVINPLINAGLIEMAIPDKPRSSKQRYRTTAAGRSVLENSEKEPQP